MHRRNMLEAAGAALATAFLSNAQQQGPTSAVVFEHDLPEVNLHNWAVNVHELTYAPGGTSPAHRHPGITLVYVLEGEIVSKVGDGPEKTYGRGQMFMENPNDLHAVSRNASSARPARFLAIQLAEKGKAPTSPA